MKLCHEGCCIGLSIGAYRIWRQGRKQLFDKSFHHKPRGAVSMMDVAQDGSRAEPLSKPTQLFWQSNVLKETQTVIAELKDSFQFIEDIHN